MSVEAITWAMHMAEAGAIPSPTAAHVLIVLADYADGDNVAWPGQKSIATRVMRSERQVRRALEELEAAGLIRAEERRRRDGARTSNAYHLNVKLAFQQPDTHDRLQTLANHAQPDTHDRGPRTPMSGHEPSVEPSVKTTPPLPPQMSGGESAAPGGGGEEARAQTQPLPSGRDLAARYAKRAEEVRVALSEPDVDLYVQFRAALRDRMPSEHAFRRWVSEVVWPELQRLGAERFRAAVAEAAPRLVDPAIRQPTAWLLKRLQQAEPPPELRWNVSQMWAGLEYRPVDDDGHPVLDPMTEAERDELLARGLARWIEEAAS